MVLVVARVLLCILFFYILLLFILFYFFTVVSAYCYEFIVLCGSYVIVPSFKINARHF